MTHVVCEPCFGCKYTDCVVVCPVECFYEGEQMLYIHPDECIDCEACVPECPVEAIFHEDNVPEEWKAFTQLNAEMAPQCPVITEKAAKPLLRVTGMRRESQQIVRMSVRLPRTESQLSTYPRAAIAQTTSNPPTSTRCRGTSSNWRTSDCRA